MFLNYSIKIDTVGFLMAKLGSRDVTILIYVKHKSQHPILAGILPLEDIQSIMQWINHGRNSALKRTGKEANRIAGIYVQLEKVLSAGDSR